MKRTVLDMTQSILSSLNSDEVNSISDTTESLQVAEILKNSYYEIIARTGMPDQKQLFQLDASTDSSIPVLMYRPENVSKIEWIKYLDKSETPYSYKDISIISLTEFLRYVNNFDQTEANVDTFEFNNIQFKYKTDAQPRFCTVMSNFYIIFDSFDDTLDSTLQTSKTNCFGEVSPQFLLEDDFIPVLDDYQFPLLLNEAKSVAFLELKQMSHPKAEQGAKRQWSSVQKDKAIVNKPSYFDALPNFGRKAWRYRLWS